MTDKYLSLNLATGRPTTKEATAASTGVADAGKIAALNSAGQLDITMMPTGIGPDVVTMPASEALSAGEYVNTWNDSGTIKARKADASTTGKSANGFVLAAVSTGQTATVYTDGTNTALTGLTLGSRYYLSATTPGAASTAVPATVGNVVQYLGVAVAATKLPFQPDDGYVIG